MAKQAMKKLLVITPHFPPFPRVGTIRRVDNFVRYLPEHGWEPVVLTMNWGYAGRPDGERPVIYHTRNIAALSWNAYRSTEVAAEQKWRDRAVSYLINIARVVKNHVLLPDELILWALWVLPRLGPIVKKEKPRALFVNGPPFSTLLIGVLAKKLYNVPVVADVRDDWVDNPLTEKPNRILRQIERRMEHFVVRGSDAVIVVTPASHALWSGRYPDRRGSIHMIPNGYNEEEFCAVPPYPFMDFALVHAGSLEGCRSPELIFRALAGLGPKAKGVRFYQYGLTVRDYKLMAGSCGVEHLVRFEDIISGKEAISRIKGASALVLIPTPNAPTAIPGKAYEYLRSGKPVILISPLNATTAFLQQFPQVHHVLPDDAAGLEAVLERITTETVNQPAASPEVLKRFDRRALTAELASLLTSISGGNSR